MEPIMTSVVTSAISSVVTKYLIPGAKSLLKQVVEAYNVNVEHIGVHFEEYLKRSYKNYSIINTLAFPNQQKALRSVYLPLTLVGTDYSINNSVPHCKINGFPTKLLSRYHKILIKDTAGMGKSTLSKIIFLSAIDQEAGIPIYIELRKLSKDHCLLDEIRDQLGSLTKDFDKQLMLALFQKGGFIFILDGFDEISLSQREAVLPDIKVFVEKAYNNTFILTSREDPSLVGFGDFYAMSIRPLLREEAYELLRKYDSNGRTSKELVKQLSSGDYERISHFLQNPFLVSLLFVGYAYRPDIPLRVTLFYERVHEALFYSHDLSKDGAFIHPRKSGLDFSEFSRCMRAIGFVSHLNGDVSFNLNDLKNALSLSHITSCTEAELFDDLCHQIPLFAKEGNQVKWIHKSIQEYYAAEYINRDANDKKDFIINKFAFGEKVLAHLPVLDLYSDLEGSVFEKDVVLPVLEEFVSTIEKEITNGAPGMEARIRRRRQFLFYCSTYLYFFNPKDMARSPYVLLDIIKTAMPYPSGKIGIRLSEDRWVISFFYPQDRFELIQLIIKKYPSLKATLDNKYLEADLSSIVTNQTHRYDESFMSSNPDVYDVLDTFNLVSIFGDCEYSFLGYTQAIEMVSSIKKTRKENDDILTALMGK